MTDAGLAADSVSERNGISQDEAIRRLMLQEVLSDRRAEVQAAEAGRVARVRQQHDPYFAMVVTLTGTEDVSSATREVLCRTPELEVHLGAQFTQDELVAEMTRLQPQLSEFGPDLQSWWPGDQMLEFSVINDAAQIRLEELLTTATDYPFLVSSLGIPPLVLDPSVPFPLLDVTGRNSSGVGLEGILTIEGPCVYLNDRLVILPARETTWNPDTGVLNTGGGDLRSGDRVTGGGNTWRQPLEDLDQPPDPSCRIDGEVLQGSFAPVDPRATAAPVPPDFPPATPVPGDT